jgi:hypothetical protein
MRLGKVGQGADKDGTPIEALDALDRVRVARLANDLQIKFIQCLYVVRREGDWDQHEVLLTFDHVFLNRA